MSNYKMKPHSKMHWKMFKEPIWKELLKSFKLNLQPKNKLKERTKKKKKTQEKLVKLEEVAVVEVVEKPLKPERESIDLVIMMITLFIVVI